MFLHYKRKGFTIVATVTTKNPYLMSLFFLHIGFDNVEASLREYEQLRGEVEEIEVVFFKEVEGKCPVRLSSNDTYFSAVKSFQFSDKQENRQWTHRQLLVTLG